MGRSAAAVGVLAGVLLVSGCSSGSDRPAAGSGSAAPSSSLAAPSSPAPSASATPSVDLAAASADEILAQARAALLAARSVHAKGVVRSGNAPFTLDLQLVRGAGATGTIAGQGTSLGVVRIGSAAYIKLDRASWRAVTGNDRAARQFAGKYLKVTSSNSDAFGPFLALTDLDQVFASLLTPTGTVTKGAVTTIGGRRVLDLRIDSGRTGDVFVALDGPPYPVRLSYGGGGAQQVDLDGFGRDVKLTAPPASQVASV